MGNCQFWQTDSSIVRKKENDVVVKLRDDNGKFIQSIRVPSIYYPLNQHYELFFGGNCSEVKDPEILSLFDQIPYKIGFCYTNTKALLDVFKAAGICVVPYAGWTFFSCSQLPFHHSWLVLKREGELPSILDLADDGDQTFTEENNRFLKIQDMEESRKNFARIKKQQLKLSNHDRCAPVGIPYREMLYIGCPCHPDMARKDYQQLMQKYPNHECEANCDSRGLNKTQKLLLEL